MTLNGPLLNFNSVENDDTYHQIINIHLSQKLIFHVCVIVCCGPVGLVHIKILKQDFRIQNITYHTKIS